MTRKELRELATAVVKLDTPTIEDIEYLVRRYVQVRRRTKELLKTIDGVVHIKCSICNLYLPANTNYFREASRGIKVNGIKYATESYIARDIRARHTIAQKELIVTAVKQGIYDTEMREPDYSELVN